MTKRELNAAIRKLYRRFEIEKFDTDKEKELKEELYRLWRADSDKSWTGYREFKMLLKMNGLYRVIPLHNIHHSLKI